MIGMRHTGILVKNLEEATKTYQTMGFKLLEPVETLRVQKLIDINGNVFELVEGNWHRHIAVDWYEDDDRNCIEIVKEAK